MPVNIEIKARSADPSFIREWLLSEKALFKGTDLQTDTYFHVPKGRLKLRQGNIENNLIYYERADQHGPKQSDFSITPVKDPDGLLAVLTSALGVWIRVQKKREIYFIGNVKFHIDEVGSLGSFIEIEAGDLYSDIPIEELRAQCDYYMNVFGIVPEDLIDRSYSDLLMDLLP